MSSREASRYYLCTWHHRWVLHLAADWCTWRVYLPWSLAQNLQTHVSILCLLIYANCERFLLNLNLLCPKKCSQLHHQLPLLATLPTPTRLNSTVESCQRRRCVWGIRLLFNIYLHSRIKGILFLQIYLLETAGRPIHRLPSRTLGVIDHFAEFSSSLVFRLSPLGGIVMKAMHWAIDHHKIRLYMT